jgi:hypothetical protein
MMREWWNQLKQKGSSHYRSEDDIQPIDLMLAGGGFRFWCTYNIVKYAFRQRTRETGGDNKRLRKDVGKIKHYADLLLCSELGEDTVLEKLQEEWRFKDGSTHEDRVNRT